MMTTKIEIVLPNPPAVRNLVTVPIEEVAVLRWEGVVVFVVVVVVVLDALEEELAVVDSALLHLHYY
jgi:hypothetical protein